MRERQVIAAMDESSSVQLELDPFCAMDARVVSDDLKIRCIAVRKDAASRSPVFVTVNPASVNPNPSHSLYQI
jgi:hypothetical protein